MLLGFGALSVAYAMTVRVIASETSLATTDTPEIVQTPATTEKSWQSKTLSNLREVEDLLDGLEACGVKESEVQILGESTFAVRWR
jgi:hypothetical protein